MALNRCPPEIWLQIFEAATHEEPLVTGYSPFQVQTILHTASAVESSLKELSTTLTITMVCHAWRHLALHLFYKEIFILHGVYELQNALTRAHPNAGRNGGLVKRIVLPWQCTAGPPVAVTPSVDILKLCAKAEILARPYACHRFGYGLSGSTFDYEPEEIPLPSLLRLEWSYNSDAERSGGVNSLVSVLHGAPNLQYLFVGDVTATGYVYLDKSPVYLEELDCLRLSSISPLLVRQIIKNWSLPSLTKLVLDSPLPEYCFHHFFEAFGANIRTLELGTHSEFARMDYLRSSLQNCPNLEELNYHIFFTATPAIPTGIFHPKLAAVGLHAAHNPFTDEAQAWELLRGHFVFLNAVASTISATLHGDWDEFVRSPKFNSLRESSLRVEVCTNMLE